MKLLYEGLNSTMTHKEESGSTWSLHLINDVHGMLTRRMLTSMLTRMLTNMLTSMLKGLTERRFGRACKMICGTSFRLINLEPDTVLAFVKLLLHFSVSLEALKNYVHSLVTRPFFCWDNSMWLSPMFLQGRGWFPLNLYLRGGWGAYMKM